MRGQLLEEAIGGNGFASSFKTRRVGCSPHATTPCHYTVDAPVAGFDGFGAQVAYLIVGVYVVLSFVFFAFFQVRVNLAWVPVIQLQVATAHSQTE